MQDLTKLLESKELHQEVVRDLNKSYTLNTWYKCLEVAANDKTLHNMKFRIIRKHNEYLELRMEKGDNTYIAYERIYNFEDLTMIKEKLFNYLYDEDKMKYHIKLNEDNIIKGLECDYLDFKYQISKTSREVLIPIISTFENTIHELKKEIYLQSVKGLI